MSPVSWRSAWPPWWQDAASDDAIAAFLVSAAGSDLPSDGWWQNEGEDLGYRDARMFIGLRSELDPVPGGEENGMGFVVVSVTKCASMGADDPRFG